MLEVLRQQVGAALRSLRRSPTFTIVAAGTLALGIGSATTVFGVLSAAFLRPLPYDDPDRLVAISETRRGDEISVSYPNFLDWREGNSSFQHLAAFAGQSMTLGGDAATPERIRGQLVTSNLFAALGVSPVVGRGFNPEEDRVGAERVAIIGHGLWQRRFAGDPGVIGRVVLLDRQAFTVVGVMPPGFDFPGGLVYGPAEMWLPLGVALNDDWLNRQSHPGLQAIGRLRPGVSFQTGRMELVTIAKRLEETYPESNREQSVLVRSALDAIVGDLRPGLTLVASAVVLLLLITCANVAGLVLARGVSRHRELAIHAALGAPRSRVIGQLTVESLLLAALGGAIGVLFSWWGVRMAAPFLEGLPRLSTVSLDWRVFVFVLGASVVTGLLCGVGPAFASTGQRIERWLRERGGSANVMSSRTRQALVAGEIALSLVLVVGATLLARSFVNLRAAPGGINPAGVLTFEIRLPETAYRDGAPVTPFFDRLVGELGSVAGVTSTGAVSTLPFSGAGAQSGLTTASISEPHRTDVATVTPDYFRTMGITLLRGRGFGTRDDSLGPRVAVVDERLAERFWPGQDPIGQRLGGWGFHELTVIGVVRHVKNYGVASDSREELYVSHAQRPARRMIVVVRSSLDTDALATAARRIVSALDPELPLYSLRTMQSVVDATITAPRLSALIGTAVASLALVLAAIGMHGMLAFIVGQRIHDIGVRLALGATPGAVAGSVARQALMIALVGVAVGVAGAVGMVQLIRSQLYGVSPIDVPTVAIAAAAFVTITVVASWLPARRASRVSPVIALQAD